MDALGFVWALHNDKFIEDRDLMSWQGAIASGLNHAKATMGGFQVPGDTDPLHLSTWASIQSGVGVSDRCGPPE